MSIRIPMTTLALLIIAALLAQGCAQLRETERLAVRSRAANEHDCHQLAMDVVPLEDKKKVWRAIGCGHETFWECNDAEDGPDVCDRVEFPFSESKLLRF